MLGTPPAFILSQDQTLKCLYLNQLVSLLNKIEYVYLSFLLCRSTNAFSFFIFRFSMLWLWMVFAHSNVLRSFLYCLFRNCTCDPTQLLLPFFDIQCCIVSCFFVLSLNKRTLRFFFWLNLFFMLFSRFCLHEIYPCKRSPSEANDIHYMKFYGTCQQIF